MDYLWSYYFAKQTENKTNLSKFGDFSKRAQKSGVEIEQRNR